jgi:pimeloyl-ACP methyl ester carboxylesterase
VQRANRRLLRELGLPRIPDEDLARITVPTTLIWGREDRVMKLRNAEQTARRQHWKLEVIDDAGHVVFVDQLEATLAALQRALRN